MIENALLKAKITIGGIIAASSVIALDRISENYALSYLDNATSSIKVLPFFNLVWTGNSGISFGMLQGLEHGKWLLSAMAIIITGCLFMWLLRVKSLQVGLALGLIIGGALGNIFERLTYGYVIDILDFHAFGYHWPAFNINDSAIFCGVTLIMFYEFFTKKEKVI